MTRRIVLHSRLPGQDAFGQRVLTWTDYLAGLEMASPKPVTAVTAGAVTRLTCVAHGWREGQLVRLAGITGVDGLPCTFGVLDPATDAFSVRLNTTDSTLVLASATATPMTGVPVQIEPLRSREQVSDDAIGQEITHQLTMRYHRLLIDPLAVASLRAVHVHGSITRTFNLSPALNVDSRNRWLTIQASEGLTQG